MEYLNLIRDEDDRSFVQRVAQNDPTLTTDCDVYYGLRGCRSVNHGGDGYADLLLAMGHAMKGNAFLRSLSLGDELVLTKEAARAMADGMAQSKLERLRLEGNLKPQGANKELLSQRICDIFYRGIQESNIYYLDLNQSLTNDPGNAWRDALLGLREITIRLSENHCDGYARAFSEVLSRTTLLTTLTVEIDNAESAGVTMFARGLCQNTSITSLTLTNKLYGNTHLSRQHVQLLLAQGLNPNSSITTLSIYCFNMDDGCIELLVDRWLPTCPKEELSFFYTTIGPSRAQRLMQALAVHPTMVTLDLSYNMDIGYEGLRLIGNELPNLQHLANLDLDHCSTWNDDLEAESEAAQVQMRACQQAGQALLDGIKHNLSITTLRVSDNHFPQNVEDEINFYCALNKGRDLLAAEENPGLAPSLWCQVLASCQHQNLGTSLVYFYLKELPTLVQSCRH